MSTVSYILAYPDVYKVYRCGTRSQLMVACCDVEIMKEFTPTRDINVVYLFVYRRTENLMDGRRIFSERFLSTSPDRNDTDVQLVSF